VGKDRGKTGDVSQLGWLWLAVAASLALEGNLARLGGWTLADAAKMG
jgi:hypothetical protein